MDILSNKTNLFKLEWIQDTQEFSIWKAYITKTEVTNTTNKAKELLIKILNHEALQLLNIKSIHSFEKSWLFLVEVNELILTNISLA